MIGTIADLNQRKTPTSSRGKTTAATIKRDGYNVRKDFEIMEKIFVCFDVGEYTYADYVNGFETGDFGLTSEGADYVNEATVMYVEYLCRTADYSGSVIQSIYEDYWDNGLDDNTSLGLYCEYEGESFKSDFISMTFYPTRERIEITREFDGSKWVVGAIENVTIDFLRRALKDDETVEYLAKNCEGLYDLNNEDLVEGV